MYFGAQEINSKHVLKLLVTQTSGISRVFLDRPVHTLNPQMCYHGRHQLGKFSKFVPPDALKMHPLIMPVLRFLCKTSSKLLNFVLQDTLLCG